MLIILDIRYCITFIDDSRVRKNMALKLKAKIMINVIDYKLYNLTSYVLEWHEIDTPTFPINNILYVWLICKYGRIQMRVLTQKTSYL